MATSKFTVSTVFVVDGEPATRAETAALVQSLGFDCRAFSSAEEFLDVAVGSRLGCVIVGLALEGMDAFQLQERLAAAGSVLPVIFVGTHFSVNEVVRAMRGGAYSVLETPFSDKELGDTIRKAVAVTRDSHDAQRRLETLRAKFRTLNPRERDVMTLVVAGVPTKTIARELGVCHRTAAQIRADVFKKMDADSAVDLAIIAGDLWRSDRKGIVIHTNASEQSSFAQCAT